MAIDFDKIDRTVDLKGLQADVEDAKKNGGGDFPTIPAGKYEARVESMEIKGTKADPNRPMLAVSFKILSGEYKNQRLFMNRVLYGTKNDKNMIASAMGFLEKLDSGVPVSFTRGRAARASSVSSQQHKPSAKGQPMIRAEPARARDPRHMGKMPKCPW